MSEDPLKVEQPLKKETQGNNDLRSLLVEITLSRSRAISRGIEEIDLGGLGIDAQAILDQSLADDTGVETGKDIFVTPEKKLFISQHTIKGRSAELNTELKAKEYKLHSELSLTVSQLLASFPRDVMPKRQNRYYVCTMHSHGIHDSPPSSPDLYSLFLNELDPFASSVVFIISANRIILVFRGENTPEWSREFSNIKIKQWSKMYLDAAGKRASSIRNQDHFDEVSRSEQESWLKSVALKYDLRVFACPSWESKAKLQNPKSNSFLKLD